MRRALACALLLAARSGSGNEAPVLSIHVGANQSFLRPSQPLEYIAVVSDAEDGDTLAGSIDAQHVALWLEYAGNPSAVSAEPRPVDPRVLVGATRGRELIAGGDCVVCHLEASPVQQRIPTYTDIARRFEGNMAAAEALAVKIIHGSQFAWGEIPMPGHADLETEAALAMAYYILSFARADRQNYLPLSGSVTAALDGRTREGAFGAYLPGRYVLRASYQDAGDAASAPAFGHAAFPLRHPHVLAGDHDLAEGLQRIAVDEDDQVLVASGESGYLMLRALDLSGVRHVTVATLGARDRWPGGRIEFRQGAPSGPRIGAAEISHDGAALELEKVRVPLAPNARREDLFIVLRGRDGIALGSLCFDC